MITPEYSIWVAMRARCRGNHRNYGARGITVCERWNSFANFLADMGPRPSKDHSIDRINNDGNYEPGNCRWATHQQQMRNRGCNRYLTHNGETLMLVEWAERTGLLPHTILTRISRGWTIADALTSPTRVHYDIGDERLTMEELIARSGLSKSALSTRIGRGWPATRILRPVGHARGDARHGTRIADAQIRTARILRGLGVAVNDIAAWLGTTPGYVRKVFNGNRRVYA